MRSAKAELDHALANVAMAYGVSRAQLEQVKRTDVYAEQVEALADWMMTYEAETLPVGCTCAYCEGKNDLPTTARLCARLVLEGNGHFKPFHPENRIVRHLSEAEKTDLQKKMSLSAHAVNSMLVLTDRAAEDSQ